MQEEQTKSSEVSPTDYQLFRHRKQKRAPFSLFSDRYA